METHAVLFPMKRIREDRLVHLDTPFPRSGDPKVPPHARGSAILPSIGDSDLGRMDVGKLLITNADLVGHIEKSVRMIEDANLHSHPGEDPERSPLFLAVMACKRLKKLVEEGGPFKPEAADLAWGTRIAAIYWVDVANGHWLLGGAAAEGVLPAGSELSLWWYDFNQAANGLESKQSWQQTVFATAKEPISEVEKLRSEAATRGLDAAHGELGNFCSGNRQGGNRTAADGRQSVRERTHAIRAALADWKKTLEAEGRSFVDTLLQLGDGPLRDILNLYAALYKHHGGGERMPVLAECYFGKLRTDTMNYEHAISINKTAHAQRFQAAMNKTSATAGDSLVAVVGSGAGTRCFSVGGSTRCLVRQVAVAVAVVSCETFTTAASRIANLEALVRLLFKGEAGHVVKGVPVFLVPAPDPSSDISDVLISPDQALCFLEEKTSNLLTRQLESYGNLTRSLEKSLPHLIANVHANVDIQGHVLTSLGSKFEVSEEEKIKLVRLGDEAGLNFSGTRGARIPTVVVDDAEALPSSPMPAVLTTGIEDDLFERLQVQTRDDALIYASLNRILGGISAERQKMSAAAVGVGAAVDVTQSRTCAEIQRTLVKEVGVGAAVDVTKSGTCAEIQRALVKEVGVEAAVDAVQGGFVCVDLQRALVEEVGVEASKAILRKTKSDRGCIIDAKRGHWSPDEDKAVKTHVDAYGSGHWRILAAKLHGRNEAQCRNRWCEELDPTINKGPWNAGECAIFDEAHLELGNSWPAIAKRLPGRTVNAVKNRWYCQKRLKKRREVCAAASGCASAAAAAASGPRTGDEENEYVGPEEAPKAKRARGGGTK